MKIACCFDVGPRENLEDLARAFTIATPFPVARAIPVLLVFDGVGGNASGEVAAALGARYVGASLAASLVALCDESESIAPDSILDILVASLEEANRAVLAATQADATLRGMATTAACALIVSSVLYVAWVGDSRCYLRSSGRFRRVTHDHSEIQQLVDAGLISPEDTQHHPAAHVITHYLGQARGFEVATRACRVLPGDVILLCTDGLTDVVPDSEIATSVAAVQDDQVQFEHLPRRLVDQALRAGVQDNVTVLCCEYQPVDVPRRSDRTITSAYPLQLAQVLQQLL